jgi:dolichol-phosphate mannosyltransferase
VLQSVSIVVPAYNEAASIEATLADALEVGPCVTDNLEVLVLDDGSADDTGRLVAAAAAQDPRIRLIGRAANRGIEASLRQLYAEARGEWVFLMSADRQWPMQALLDLAAAAEAGADFVVGARRNKREFYTRYRQVVSWSYERIVRALGAPTGDPGSIKLARKELLDADVASTGVFAEGERIVRAARGGARVVEVPVEFVRRNAGKATGARRDVVARAMVDVVRVVGSLSIGWPKPRR